MFGARIAIILAVLLALTACNFGKNPESELTDFIHRAETYLEVGHYQKANLEIQKALQLDIQNVQAHALLTQYLFAISNLSGANEVGEKTWQFAQQASDGQHLSTEFWQAWLSAKIKLGDLTEAQVLLERMERPSNPIWTWLRAELYIEAGQLDLAEQLITPRVQGGNGAVEDYLLLARVALRDQRFDDIQGFTDQAASLDQDNLQVWLWQGRLAILKEDYPAAEDAFSRAMFKLGQADVMTFDKFMTLNGLVKSLLAQGHVEQAMVYSQQLKDAMQNQFRGTYEAGLASYQSGKLSDAESAFRNILKRDPSHGMSNLMMALIEHDRGDEETARNYLDTLDSDQVTTLEGKVLVAKAYLTVGDVPKAIAIIEEHLSKSGLEGQTESVWLLGVSYMQLKDIPKANEYLELAVRNKPNEVKYLIALAETEYRLQRNEKARQLLSEAISLAPGNANALRAFVLVADNKAEAAAHLESLANQHGSEVMLPFVLAQYHYSVNQLDVAAQWAQRALNIAPDENDVVGLVLSLTTRQVEEAYRKNDWLAVVEKSQKGLNLIPDLVPLQIAQANAQAKLGQFDSAKDRAKALVSSPKTAMAGHELNGDIAIVEGERADAEKHYMNAWSIRKNLPLALKIVKNRQAIGTQLFTVVEDWAKSDPNKQAALQGLALLYEEMKQPALAELQYRLLLKDYPDDLIALNNLTWLTLKKDRQSALTYANRAQRLAPNNGAILDTYGWALYKNGRAEDALSPLEKALALKPQDGDIRSHLVEVYRSLGRTQDATRLIDQLVDDQLFN